MNKFSIITIRPYLGSNGRVYLSFQVDGKLRKVQMSTITLITNDKGELLQMTPSVETILASEVINVYSSNSSNSSNNKTATDNANAATDNANADTEIPF